MPNTWTISEEQAGLRLDVFLSGVLPDLSRAAIQKDIRGGVVTVNDAAATSVHQFLKVADRIAWQNAAGGSKGTKNGHKRNEKTTEAPSETEPTKLEIISETPDWMVINKPAGLLVHPDAKTPHGTLVDLLIAHDPRIAKIGADPERPGIVHRLDREVSGLMIVAKTQAAFDSLQDQFAQRHVKKTYLALVHGEVSHDEGDIKLSLARSTTKARMAALPRTTRNGEKPEEGGKAAWTHYRVVERFVGATLLELQILSGRTHQIRAHLHAIGHPVIGDALYTIRRTDRNVHPARMMLESVALEFNDPATGERKAFRLDPDPAFATMVEEFRKS